MDRLHRDIKALSNSETHNELAKQTQKILFQMAYYISQSEGIVLDQREEWHKGSTRILSEEAGMPN